MTSSENGTGENGEHGALEAEKSAGHEHHFDVTEAHAFAAAKAEVAFGDGPENAGADRAPMRASTRERTHIGRREGEELMGEEGGGAVADGTKRLRRSPIAKPGKFMSSGRMRSRRSVKMRTTMIAEKMIHLRVARREAEGEIAGEERAAPVRNSTADTWARFARGTCGICRAGRDS